MTSDLPEEFKDLLPFVEWGLSTELARNTRRWSVSMDESQKFYDAMLKRGPDALAYLNQFPLAEISGADLTLLHMCLALAECSATIEMYEEPQPKYVFPIARFVPTHDAWSLTGTGDRA